MRARISRLAERASGKLRDATATITRAATGAGLDAGHVTWTNPTTVGTTPASLQPASREAQEAAGLTVAANRVAIYLSPHAFRIEPLTHRVTINDQTFTVLSVEEWPSHTRVIAERA
jgi:hypothetical protein